MKINFIFVGTMKREYKNLIDIYYKKLSFYTKINFMEIKEIKHPNIEVVKQKETQIILSRIPKNSKAILCSFRGELHTSEEFANLLLEDNITFVVGGSNGVDESQFKNKIAFSKMTFPHQLFRIFLVEQVYRGFSINNNSKYHK